MEIYYTPDDDWISVAAGVATIGITEQGQARLGAIMFVQLPAMGTRLRRGGAAALIESVKSASDVFAPIGGTVRAINAALDLQPSLVNVDPEGAGWLFRLTLADPAELTGLLRRDAYMALVRQP